MCLFFDTALRDHPRGCGAHQREWQQQTTELGSSPRVRGSQVVTLAAARRRGIIPAGAGLTQSAQAARRHHRDHPRGCGAHIPTARWPRRAAGSSPRVRGSLKCRVAPVGHARIIPAGAGLTSSATKSAWSIGDHPRGCGAHQHKRRGRTQKPGSSPRVRGSRFGLFQQVEQMGIIPAGAGLTTYMHLAST